MGPSLLDGRRVVDENVLPLVDQIERILTRFRCFFRRRWRSRGWRRRREQLCNVVEVAFGGCRCERVGNDRIRTRWRGGVLRAGGRADRGLHRERTVTGASRLTCSRRCGWSIDVEGRKDAGDLLVAWIRLEDSPVPGTGRLAVAVRARDVAEMAQRDEVLGIQCQRRLEDASGFVVPTRLEERLSVDDVAAHMPRLLRQELLADEDRLVEVADLPVFVGERREISTGILVEFLAELVDARSTGHG